MMQTLNITQLTTNARFTDRWHHAISEGPEGGGSADPMCAAKHWQKSTQVMRMTRFFVPEGAEDGCN